MVKETYRCSEVSVTSWAGLHCNHLFTKKKTKKTGPNCSKLNEVVSYRVVTVSILKYGIVALKYLSQVEQDYIVIIYLLKKKKKKQGPIVQNLTKLLATVSLQFLSWNMANTLIFFAEKMWVIAKASYCFCSKNNQCIWKYLSYNR